MVPEPSLGRRRLLAGVAGLAGLGTAGTVAVGATEPTALPDVLTDEATKHYPTPPEVTELWRPTVTEAHARGAVDLLAETVEAAEPLWERIETDRHFTGAGGWLESAREELEAENYHEALFYATGGAQFAGEALGYARAKLDEADLQRLAERSYALLDRGRAVAQDLKPYPAADPGRDLGWYYGIEKQLVLARLDFAWDGMEAARDGEELDGATYDARAVGEITAGLLQGRIRVHNAEQYRDRHADLLDDPERDYQGHLDRVSTAFRNAVEELPSRESLFEEHIADVEEFGPYEFARAHLARWCYDATYWDSWADDEPLLAYRAAERSRMVAQRRAHDVAVRNLAVDPDDEGFDSGHALAEKRRARAAYQEVVGDDPPALLTRQVRRAVEDLQVAKVGFAGSYRDTLWKERLEAYLYALVGRAKLREYPGVYEEIVGEKLAN